ncbi:MAG: hypothetical protein H6876_09370 [Hyphomicrobiaceae bacterium]|nr:hypothetical protein [Hyphomicrobiaceae bacterium]
MPACVARVFWKEHRQCTREAREMPSRAMIDDQQKQITVLVDMKEANIATARNPDEPARQRAAQHHWYRYHPDRHHDHSR